MADNPLQLRMRILQLRMDYLSNHNRTRAEEEALLADLDAAVRRLKEVEAGPTGGPAAAPPDDERRAEPRTPAALPVVLKLVRSDGKTHYNLSISRDIARHGISLVGISLVAHFEPRSGEHVKLDIGFPDGRRAADVGAEVRWCTPVWTHPGNFLVGLKFTDIPPDAKTALEQVRL